MNFSNIIKQKNVFFLPFSWGYQAGVWLFHKLYDIGVLKSYQPGLPTICVGNLSVGGTGKSPMVEYLIRLLRDRFAVAVVSRGYKRKTKGFLLAGEQVSVTDIGDEPMQFHTKFPQVTLAVGEKRAEAIALLMQQKPETAVVVLDDAFQHRQVAAGLNILLTAFDNMFTQDWLLPAGSLRDLRSNYKRAQVIVVTKSPPGLTDARRQEIIRAIRPLPHQKVFFSAIAYANPYAIFKEDRLLITDLEDVILVTGIANPEPVTAYLRQHNIRVQHISFPDHHHFSEGDIRDILQAYKGGKPGNKIILTTEKDAMRLRAWAPMQALPVYALPIAHHFLFDEGRIFEELVTGYVAQQVVKG